eukprot:3270279-Amphidinium_carterae.1
MMGKSLLLQLQQTRIGAQGCGSLSALNFFRANPAKYVEFRVVCEQRCKDTVYVFLKQVLLVVRKVEESE